MVDIFADRFAEIGLPWQRMRQVGGFVAGCCAAERDRWGLWIPVGLGAGIGLYFSLTIEPPLWLGVSVTLAFAGIVLAARRWHGAAGGWIAAASLPVGIVAAGLTLAQFETWRVSAPVITRDLGIVPVSGRVTDIELQETGIRVTLAPDRIGRVSQLPRLIRLKLRHEVDGLTVGDQITLRAAVMPPPGPAIPGGFDFQRQAWFNGLGGVGYGVGTVVVAPLPTSGASGIVKSMRMAMTDRIRAALPAATGGIAAALITGERGAVPQSINQDYRDSGLAHLLVIAGLHMTLVTGFVFFAVRGTLALFPHVALRYPIKKWAAGAALCVAVLYLVISGAAIPTQRAFVMVALGLAAILIDRANVSMRAVAWAAGAVLICDPAALIGVSFQMSFAAVVGLVAFYETFGGRLAALRRGAGPIGRAALMLLGIALTTIVATIGTAAFSIYHFDRFAVFSVLANLIAVPMAAFWVMPWAFVACLLMPFGAEALGLVPMGWGIGWIERVAHLTATLPGAVLDLPAMPNWGLLAVTVGGLWLALWRLPWRWWGVIPIALGLCSIATVHPPDLIASADGRLVGLKIGGTYRLSSEKIDKAEAGDWLRAAGGIASAPLPAPGSADGPLRCDGLGCLWQSPAGLVALDHDPAAIEEDCRHAVVLVTDVTPGRACHAEALIVASADLRRNGATAIWFDHGVRMATANGLRGNRPWVIHEEAYVPRSATTSSRHPRANSDAAIPPDAPAP